MKENNKHSLSIFDITIIIIIIIIFNNNNKNAAYCFHAFRYKGTKMERARDLFEQALDTAPEDVRKVLYLQYAKLEEDFGLTRRAMAIYERACKAVATSDKMSVYELYITKAAEYYGVTKTREIYEEAINEGLPAENVKTMCLRYARLEKKIGEIDRARAILVHGAQLADPR